MHKPGAIHLAIVLFVASAVSTAWSPFNAFAAGRSAGLMAYWAATSAVNVALAFWLWKFPHTARWPVIAGFAYKVGGCLLGIYAALNAPPGRPVGADIATSAISGLVYAGFALQFLANPAVKAYLARARAGQGEPVN